MPKSPTLLEEAGNRIRRVYEVKEELFALLRWLEEHARHPPEPHLDQVTLEYRTLYPKR